MCPKGHHAQSFGLSTAVRKRIRKKYMRQLRCLGIDITVLVTKPALVPLRSLNGLQVLGISGKPGNIPECMRLVL